MLRTIAAGAALLVATVSTANAAIITRTYEVTSVFSQGPLREVVTSFDVSYNPVSEKRTKVEITSYKTNGGASFANPVAEYLYTPAQQDVFGDLPALGDLSIYGSLNGFGVSAKSFDFNIGIFLDELGRVQNSTSYYAADFGGIAFSTTTVRDLTPPPGITLPPSGGPAPTPAVPEPATWAMMLLGFGMIGGAARYRRRRTTLRYA